MATATARPRRILASCALLCALAVPAWGGAAPPEQAEGRYPYLASDPGAAPLVARWTALAAAMPQWKEKARRAHYRFAPGVVGRDCDQKDCHPGFTDRYVARLTGLEEGPARQAARERLQGNARCADCHAAEGWAPGVPTHRVHDDQRERLGCETCHSPGVRVPVLSGEERRFGLRDHDARNDWPAHRMDRNKERPACTRTCHVESNVLGVERVCSECHGEGKFAVASYVNPQVLVHATARASVLPPLTSGFFSVLTVVVLGALFLYILLEVVRVRKEVADE